LKTSDLPAVSYPAEGGPSLDTIEASLNRLADTKRIAAISVSMWNPAMDRERQAELVVMGLIERLIERL
jgi:arginase family enzyme